MPPTPTGTSPIGKASPTTTVCRALGLLAVVASALSACSPGSPAASVPEGSVPAGSVLGVAGSLSAGAGVAVPGSAPSPSLDTTAPESFGGAAPGGRAPGGRTPGGSSSRGMPPPEGIWGRHSAQVWHSSLRMVEAAHWPIRGWAAGSTPSIGGRGPDSPSIGSWHLPQRHSSPNGNPPLTPQATELLSMQAATSGKAHCFFWNSRRTFPSPLTKVSFAPGHAASQASGSKVCRRRSRARPADRRAGQVVYSKPRMTPGAGGL
mmetsp:Transcript_41669/g.109748  ORF Transcript_41669/g.109748 Transcript_41669/m.109748 type:complete len:263 (-) Transcript_41669:35-823(-)